MGLTSTLAIPENPADELRPQEDLSIIHPDGRQAQSCERDFPQWEALGWKRKPTDPRLAEKVAAARALLDKAGAAFRNALDIHAKATANLDASRKAVHDAHVEWHSLSEQLPKK